MKYSKSQQNLHMEKVLSIIVKNDPEFSRLSSRDICKELEEEGLHLNRGYVLKLMERANLFVKNRVKRKEHISDATEDWLKDLAALVGEFYMKLMAQIRAYPPYQDYEDIENHDLDGPADLSE